MTFCDNQHPNDGYAGCLCDLKLDHDGNHQCMMCREEWENGSLRTAESEL